MRSGLSARQVRSTCALAEDKAKSTKLRLDFPLPHPSEIKATLSEAEEIASGQVRLFGGPPVSLNFSPTKAPRDWAAYETSKTDWETKDPKFIWEPARFGWAFTLARTYHSTRDDRWAQVFWQRFEEFNEANPPLLGPNWASAQEVALRLMAFCFAAQVFSRSRESTPKRLRAICQSIAVHAARIPPTLNYARAQGNNHLLSEAAGLYSAGLFLPDHPSAARWRIQGWNTFHGAILEQISNDGTYAQHSLNYHRLMLELSLWMFCLGRWAGDHFPWASLEHLVASTRWLNTLTNPHSGQAPNLGSNDGAHFLPLSACDYFDMRPTLQAASTAFLGAPIYPSGPWDELSHWLGLTVNSKPVIELEPSPAIHNLHGPQSHAFLRAVRFTSRPNHTDQLHIDLWFKNQPITLDAGTYRYSAPLPWDNSLSGTLCHNTLSVDHKDQMHRAGKFLWLDWAQAHLVTPPDDKTLVAETDAYRKMGLTHRRTLQKVSDLHWLVTDYVISTRSPQSSHSFCLHWLLPDAPWQLQNNTLTFSLPEATIRLSLSTSEKKSGDIQLIRAGDLLSGSGEFPAYLGWYSPTYNSKLPALSIRLIMTSQAPLSLQSKWDIEPALR